MATVLSPGRVWYCNVSQSGSGSPTAGLTLRTGLPPVCFGSGCWNLHREAPSGPPCSLPAPLCPLGPTLPALLSLVSDPAFSLRARLCPSQRISCSLERPKGQAVEAPLRPRAHLYIHFCSPSNMIREHLPAWPIVATFAHSV